MANLHAEADPVWSCFSPVVHSIYHRLPWPCISHFDDPHKRGTARWITCILTLNAICARRISRKDLVASNFAIATSNLAYLVPSTAHVTARLVHPVSARARVKWTW